MHILWLNLVFLLNIFPGIVYALLRLFPYAKLAGKSKIYLYALIIVIATGLVSFQRVRLIIEVILMIVVPYCYFLVEWIYKNRKFALLGKEASIYKYLVLFPALEELNFRYMLYIECQSNSLPIWVYISLSVLSFLVTHVYYQGKKGYIKIVFALGQTMTFIFMQNIFIVVIAHMIFNLLVYNQKVIAAESKNMW